MTAAKKITGLGYDENFGGIDLSGCPSAREMPKDQSFIDERFSQLDATGSGHGSSALKRFIAEQTGEKTEPSTIHIAGEPFKIHLSENVWHGEGTLNGQRHRLTANDREQLVGKLMALAKRDAIRELTRAEQLQVIRLCQNGQKCEAIDLHLKLALGQSRYADDSDLLAKPELLPLMNEIAEFTWFHSTPQAQDTEEWHAFKDQFLNGRPVTHDLLDAAHESFHDHQKQSRYALLSPQVEEPPVDPRTVAESLEDMTDAQVDAQYKAVARSFAQRR